MIVSLVIALVILQSVIVEACRTIRLQSSSANLDYVLTQIPIDEQQQSELLREFQENGRPMYRLIENEGRIDERIFYLFHEKTSDNSGTARWVFASCKPDSTRAFRKYHLSFHALVESWAILPQLIGELTDSRLTRSKWQYKSPTDKRWSMNGDVQVTCVPSSLEHEEITDIEQDDVVFFESSVTHQHHLSGFYVRRYLSPHHSAFRSTSAVYSKIKIYPEDALYTLYDIAISEQEDGSILRHWLISNEGIGGDMGIAYVAHTSTRVGFIPDDAVWNFIGQLPDSLDDSSRGSSTPRQGWLSDATARVLSVYKYKQSLDRDTETQQSISILQVLRELRRLQVHPANAMQQILPNGVGLPRIGLGTGSMPHDVREKVFFDAIAMGYQLFDLAREYGNEHILGHVATYQRRTNPQALREMRSRLFYETKVWPTNLGFEPTVHEVLASLGDLQTQHVDLYLLHWPACDASVDWMHCEDTIDPQGTWHQSWKALEKLYAEGFLQAIGVSNFDETLLRHMEHKVATILPHVVQNYASLDHLDKDVRSWCASRGIAYQPYASVRNLQHMPPAQRVLLQELAARHSSSSNSNANHHTINEHEVVLKFFLQTGACIIPRATQRAHLQSNLQLWSWGLSDEELASLGWEEATEANELTDRQQGTTTSSSHDDML